MTDPDLSPVYTTTSPAGGAELRCTQHPDWWSGVDGALLPVVVSAAADHLTAEHHLPRPNRSTP